MSSHRNQNSGVRIEFKEKLGYAILWMGSEPVNSMTLELWTAMSDALTELERDPKVRGVIFASELKKNIFTAGNDIKELYAKTTSKARYTQFWRTQTSFLCRLLRSPLATVCAIRGACPAGGCAVALCCDYRVQSDAGTFGLNEVQLGIPVPKYWAKLFCMVAGHTAGDLTLQLGTLLTPSEAKVMGLLHEVVPIAAVLPAAERAMSEKFLRRHDGARGATKANLRGEFSDEWESYIDEEAAAGWAMLSTPEVEAALGGVIARLSKGTKAKL